MALDSSSLAFIATVTIATIATLLNFVWVEQDIQTRSDRPIYLYIIAWISWFISIGFLWNPISSTAHFPAQSTTSNSFNGVAWTNTITTVAAYNVTTTSNQPINQYNLYEWGSFAGMMAILNIIFWIIYMLRRSTTEIGDVLDDLDSKK